MHVAPLLTQKCVRKVREESSLRNALNKRAFDIGAKLRISFRGIRNLIGGISKIGDTPMFMETTYIHPQNGQEYPMFVMNRDGFTLLAMGFTGEKALHGWRFGHPFLFCHC